MSGETTQTLGVTDAMVLARSTLERLRLRVVGEVTGATIKPGYKAIYFSLKDTGSVMPCLMWRDSYETSGVLLADGQLVEVTGHFTAYAAKGRLQFQVQSVVVAGEGALRLQVAVLARALEADGLMSPTRKRPLPAFPERIGVVTSPRGKAVHDIIRTLERRYPSAELVIAGVQVEGEGAIAEIVHGITLVGEEPGIDVVIVGRGGGSYEDLMPFNAEEVARAIAACPVPVVTGIGHEPDTSIADMVADVRASTPTAAAEAVAPERGTVARRLTHDGRALGTALRHVVSSCEHRLDLARRSRVLSDPDALLGVQLQWLDLATASLDRALPLMLDRHREAVRSLGGRLHREGTRVLRPFEERARQGRTRLAALGGGVTAAAEASLGTTAARLGGLSPLAILARGYAVCCDADGAPVRSAASVTEGDRVEVLLHEGRLGCVVESIEAEA